MERKYYERCYYCGKILPEGEGHNAEDYGLHKETLGKSCCGECDKIVTITNRCISQYIRNNQSIRSLEEAVSNLMYCINKKC